jgi:hypothetical protein
MAAVALFRSRTVHKLVGRPDIDATMQGSIKGAAHRIAAVYFLDHTTNILWNSEPMVYEDSPNHQNSFLGLHLATHIAAECSSA